jgi:hypothetical protein
VCTIVMADDLFITYLYWPMCCREGIPYRELGLSL